MKDMFIFVFVPRAFNDRKSDGKPVAVSIWRGLIKLEAKVEMFRYPKEKNQL